jgi:predicted Zn-dependent protease
MPKNKKSLRLKKKHDRALACFKRGDLSQSARILEDLLKQKDNAEWWNDWASVQLARGLSLEAARGYRRALELEPSNREAELNFGILLAATGRDREAVRLLQRGVASLEGENRLQIMQLIDMCERKLAREAKSREIRA